MGKFRSKLKRNNKGKQWGHGQSATSNPEQKKHRNKARSRFFQPNLSLAPTDSALTAEAVYKHDVRQSFVSAPGGTARSTVNDIASSLRSFALDGDEELGQSELGTMQTHKTFASTYSACTNMSFSKLLNGFRADSPLHKEMLAILAALTATINERSGTGTSTEYFLALMASFDTITARGDQETIAAVNLLSMGIKSVPAAILRARFAETAPRLLAIMERYRDDAEHINTLRAVLSCMSALLRALAHAEWAPASATLRYFDAMLHFVTHSKPKIRKSAQQAVTSVIHGSCFMVPQRASADAGDDAAELVPSTVTFHPAGARVARFACAQFEDLANAHTTVLHTLGLLRDTLAGFRGADIQTVCERLLSIMTAANVLIRTQCFHVLHSLFAARSRNLSAELTGRLITALMSEYRPEKSDARQTLAWLTVLKEAHCALGAYDLPMCVRAVPALVEVCAGDLWLSERNEVVSGASSAIRELFVECVRPACGTKALAEQHAEAIGRCIDAVAGALAAPFGHVATQVVLTFATVFEVAGRWFGKRLIGPLQTIGARYDAESAFRLQIEHTVLAAIPAMGAENVLRAVPLTKKNGGQELELSRSWILPLLREAVAGSTLAYFDQHILPLADNCHRMWKRCAAAGDAPMAHTYELLWNQLWGLLPGFCRRPLDMENFRGVAQKLGVQLRDNAELRAPVLDGLKELMAGADEDGQQRMGVYARNFLPLLFNIYMTKPAGSYEGEIRASALEVIQQYLKITPRATLDQMYEMARAQQAEAEAGTFKSEALYDIIEHLALYQTAEQLKQLFDEFITPVLRKQKKAAGVAKGVEKIKKQQRKAYLLLQNVLQSELAECEDFVSGNVAAIQELVLSALKTTCNTTQAARLNCIKLLIDRQTDITLDNALVIRTIPEIIVAFNHGANKRDNVALNLIIRIGEICRADDKLNDFVDTVLAGFGGDSVLITNTILVLKAVVAHFALNLTVNTLKFMLEQVLVFVVGKSRNEVEAAIAFLITFIKTLPAPFVALQLESIVRALSAMVPDTKRYCRIHVGFVLRKLCKRFSPEEVVRCVPGNDEVTHKKLKNIRKELNRSKRAKAAKEKGGDSDDSDDDELDANGGLEKKSYTIDDILADSDSDFDEMDDGTGTGSSKSAAAPQRKAKKQANFIQEDPENIVDLADVNAIGRITSSKPLPKTGNALIDADAAATAKAKDSNRGFATADDGRLIIAEPTRRDRKRAANKGEASDEEEDFEMDGGAAAEKHLAAKKRSLADDSDDSDDEVEAGAGAEPSRKRALLSTASMASGRTGVSTGYVAGGRGIHRPTGGAASARSGVSGRSLGGVSTATTAKSFGQAFKAKKAGGDVKKGKVDPYAYIPLSRQSMNKRTRAKNAGQFNGVVKGARKGAAAGSKGRILKKAAGKRK